MSLNPAVRRFHNDLARLHQARREERSDQRDLRQDQRALAKDRRELERDRGSLKKDVRQVAHDGKVIAKEVSARDTTLAGLDQKKQAVADRLAADTFDYDPITAGTQQSPERLQQLADLTQRRDDAAANFATRIQAARDARAEDRDAVEQDRVEIGQDRKAINHERLVVRHDKSEIKQDRKTIAKDRHKALEDLRPAEYKMGLEATNRARRDLGLSAVHRVIRPMDTSTVQGCAQFLLKSGNVSFWSGLSSGSDRKNVERLARGEKAYVPATGGYVTPKLKMMQALVAMAKQGRVQINALTGGTHSVGSNHYSGTAVDLDVSTGNAGMIAAVARKYGGYRNSETSHIHLDF